MLTRAHDSSALHHRLHPGGRRTAEHLQARLHTCTPTNTPLCTRASLQSHTPELTAAQSSLTHTHSALHAPGSHTCIMPVHSHPSARMPEHTHPHTLTLALTHLHIHCCVHTPNLHTHTRTAAMNPPAHPTNVHTHTPTRTHTDTHRPSTTEHAQKGTHICRHTLRTHTTTPHNSPTPLHPHLQGRVHTHTHLAARPAASIGPCCSSDVTQHRSSPRVA